MRECRVCGVPEDKAEFKNGGKQLQLTGNLIGGLKKSVFDSEDFGSIVISTFAAPHTS